MNLMSWEKWVKKQLRMYLCSQLEIERLEADLCFAEKDISPSISQITGMPKAKGSKKGSIVEYEVLRKERSVAILGARLERVKKDTKCVESALNQLEDKQRSLINRLFFSLEFEKNILLDLDLSKHELRAMRREALGDLYWKLVENYRSFYNRNTCSS